MQNYDSNGQMMLFSLDEPDDVDDIFESQPKQKSKAVSLSVLISIPYFHLDLSRGHVDLFGCHYWELRSPWRENGPPLNTGPAPREPVKCALSDILETSPRRKYYLSRTACLGILLRAEERGKELPAQLKAALMAQAGLILRPGQPYHTATEPVGFDGYNGDITDQVSATLGTNCGMSTGRNGVIAPTAFAANQREKVNCRKAAREAALGREVRDIHDVAGALGAQPGMKQQAFIAENCLNPWDTQQARVFTPEGKAPTLAGADGGGGRIPGGLLFAAGVVTKGNGECYLSPERHTSISGGGGMPGQGYPCVLTAGFCAGAAPTAGGIGYQEEIAPTLKAAESGTNMVPSVLCLNDQGGAAMGCSKDVSGTLRAQEHGHQPLVYENHGVDARYTGPHPISPTLSARAGTGGNNLPLVTDAPCFCITGNAIDRQPQNGGNGIGYQENIAYTLTATDHHAVFSRQRVDVFKDDAVASTESARQHKDATDLVYQETVGALTSSDRKGPNSQYVGQDKLVVDGPLLIRRLTPLECERLQGFPDGWTDLPGASDSARYKALGNSVAIPCVEFIMRGIAMAAGY